MNLFPLLLCFGALIWLIRRSAKSDAETSALTGRIVTLEHKLRNLERCFADEDTAAKEASSTRAPTNEHSRPATVSPVTTPPFPAPLQKTEPVATIIAFASAGNPPVLPPLIETPRPAQPEPPSYSATGNKTFVETPDASIDWEQFLGVKMFAWIGGLALFLGVAFFIKYSFEHNLIRPEIRVALGFLTGISLVVAGVVTKRKEYTVAAQTLCATGVVILYAVSFACHAYYHFIGNATAFALMSAITIVAFTLAARLDAIVVAVLGLVAAFLTPPMLSTGEDRPGSLFTYVALLDVGLLALAFKKRWHFLVAMGAAGTVLIQIGWVANFFAPEKIGPAMMIFLSFDALFVLAFFVGEKLRQANQSLTSSAIALPFVTLAFIGYLLNHPALGAQPGTLFSFMLLADLCVLALVLLRSTLHPAHLAAGGVSFLLLANWTSAYLTPATLNWALAAYLIFAAIHSAFPILLKRFRPEIPGQQFGHLFPSATLLLIMLPLLKHLAVNWAIWPIVLLVDALAVGLALFTASLLSVVGVLLLTGVLTTLWIFKVPAQLDSVAPLLTIVGGFAVFFFAVGMVAEKILANKIAADEGGSNQDGSGVSAFFGNASASLSATLAQISALSAILPFFLLMMATARLPLANPSPVFGLAFFLVALLLVLVRVVKLDLLAPVALACALGLQHVWHGAHFAVSAAAIPLAWHLAFPAAFLIFPFLFRAGFMDRPLIWATAALAAPLHFFLIYRTVSFGFSNDYMGLLPAVLACPLLVCLAYLTRVIPVDHAQRSRLLAWFGGCALFFITLIFPIQFERQWLTISWALEGVALVWLFRRVPHAGLRATGFALLAVSFARLALNAAVLVYHTRGAYPIWNWYLYTYGLVIVCLLAGARLLATPKHELMGTHTPPLLDGMAGLLAFLLLNIEIADYFTAPDAALSFRFWGNFQRDMAFSIGWAMFALSLLSIGIWKSARPARYASIALLSVTLLKLFAHDLVQLDPLYRIGAFIGVAILSILASVLYQRFFAADARRENLKA
ncbi:MAG: DUF2339 domain-containing protein [Verrucomicrobia bacterium]|nr:DUF2339 domain-containing protein [Verrucomicrobiota bacterium]